MHIALIKSFHLYPMMNLDSILKNRDIILSTKVHLVKAMVYPVVMYGCESWTSERRRKADLKCIFKSELKIQRKLST